MDMQDQPRYEAYEAGDKKFFQDGASARPLVEGTVPRQPGGQYRDKDDYFFTGKVAAQPGGGAMTGASTGGMGTATPNVSADAAAGSQAVSRGGTNALGNVAGGVPGAAQAAATGGPDNFPLAIDEAALRRGQQRYNIYCGVCHGATGEGDGMIVRRGYRKPPSYYEDRLQEGMTPASHFFDVITNGWGAMPAYAEQIPAEDRWKIIAYVRALQMSRRMKMEELSPDERQKVLDGAQRPAELEHGGTQTHTQGERH
jgi:mono/diheme cytochrome c family protein